MDGKSKAWRDAADRLIEALARENKYLVSDMLIIFLESAGYGLQDYSPVGGVFKRAAKRGIISRIDRPTRQALWYSQIYAKEHLQTIPPMTVRVGEQEVPDLKKGDVIALRNFGEADGEYRIAGDPYSPYEGAVDLRLEAKE